MKQKNPFTDPEGLFDYNQKIKDVKFTEPTPDKADPVPETQRQNRIVTASYKNVEFEQPAYRDAGSSDKKLLYFDKSLERLKTVGFERHARPQEVFGLLIDGLEGKLSGSIAEVKKDMLTSYGEWMSMAFERKGDILIAHVDPEGLVWDGNKYVKQNFKSNDQQEFNVKGKESDKLILLKEFEDDLVKLLYTRPFKDLPQKMQKGNLYSRVVLPPAGTAWPVGRDSYSIRYDVVIGFNFIYGASRGVRPQKNLHKK